MNLATVCAVPGCPNLQPCPTHPREQRTGSTRAWRRLRARALRRDRHTCQQCGRRAEQVHHLRPLERGGRDTLDNLVSLCTRCHRNRHP